MTIEDAVLILNSKQWRERDDWLGIREMNKGVETLWVGVYRMPPRTPYLAEEAIAIATGLIAQDELKAAKERIVGLEREFSKGDPSRQDYWKACKDRDGVIARCVEQECELEQLRAERDALREALNILLTLIGKIRKERAECRGK